MDLHYRPQAGTPVEELDTPCLILDMDALDHNMGVMADYYSGRSAKLRGHSKNHKTPALAHRQIRRGGTVGGVCSAKVSEAEVMVQGVHFQDQAGSIQLFHGTRPGCSGFGRVSRRDRRAFQRRARHNGPGGRSA